MAGSELKEPRHRHPHPPPSGPQEKAKKQKYKSTCMCTIQIGQQGTSSFIVSWQEIQHNQSFLLCLKKTPG